MALVEDTDAKIDGDRGAVSAPRVMVSYETISFLLPVVDLLLVIGASVAAGILVAFVDEIQPGADFHALYGLGIVAAGLCILRLRDLEYYEAHSVRTPHIEMRAILEAWSISVVVLLSLLFLFKLQQPNTLHALMAFATLAPTLLLSWRILVKWSLRYAIQQQVIGRRNVVLICDAEECRASDFASTVNQFGVSNATQFVLASPAGGPLTPEDRTVLQQAVRFAQTQGVNETLVMAGWANIGRMNQIRAALRVLPLGARLLPDRHIRSLTAFSSLGPNHALQVELQRPPLSHFERGWKRGFDISLSLGALIVLAIPMALAAMLIRLESPGPAIFRQRRVGFNGKEFVIFKFRSMRVQEDGDKITQAKHGDARVTRLGRILRSTSFDELPQLLNVLRGDMSIVGPRPHAVAHDYEFAAELSEYAFRRHVKPGITGWAQCNGRRGPTPTVDDVRARVELDLWYVTNWTPFLDFYIILKTALTLVRSENAV